MREIKFRGWDKKKKVMGMIIDIDFKCKTFWFEWHVSDIRQGHYILLKDELELMQFTGLLDKNCKEIYEGDIVRMEDPELKESKLTPYIWEVIFEEPFFHLQRKFSYGRVTSNMVRLPLEVVGNIYENPELLK